MVLRRARRFPDFAVPAGSAWTAQNLDSTHFNKAYLGIDGFTAEAGFTNRDMMRAEIAAAVVGRCRNTYILADSSKFGTTALARICGADDLAGVVTNRDLPQEYAGLIESGGAALHLA